MCYPFFPNVNQNFIVIFKKIVNTQRAMKVYDFQHLIFDMSYKLAATSLTAECDIY